MLSECSRCNGTGYANAARDSGMEDAPVMDRPIGVYRCPSCGGTGKFGFSTIEAEVTAEAQEPVARYDGKDGEYGYETITSYAYIAPGAELYSAPQPPVPCPKCAQHEIDSAFEHDYKMELQAKVAELEHHVGNLLARIHRDGGHYQAEHGNDKAIRDADLIVAETYAKVYALERLTELSNIYECYDGLESKVAEQSALIEKCEKALNGMPAEGLSELLRIEALAAIAEHKKGGQ